MAGIASLAYNTLFRKTSTFVAGAIFVAFFFERSVDSLTDTIFDNYNRGVSSPFLPASRPLTRDSLCQNQWKDIKHLYEK